MRWGDIETAALDYRKKQAAKNRASSRTNERLVAYRQAEEEINREQELAAARKILARLGVEENLKAVRDEIWGEGEIVNAEQSLYTPSTGWVMERGISLISDAYPKVSLRASGYLVGANLGDEKAVLSILVGPKGKGKFIGVSDFNIYRVNDAKESGSLVELVGKFGLEDGLREANMERWKIYAPFIKRIDYADPGAAVQICNALLDLKLYREKLGSFPRQIRSWGSALADQLPWPKDSNTIGSLALKDWGRQVRGYPPLARFALGRLDRLAERVRG